MTRKSLTLPPDIEQDPKLAKQYQVLATLLAELDQKELPSETLAVVNEQIEAVNAFSGTPKARKRQIQKTRNQILKRLEKDLQLVPKNHYRTRWMALGMSVFGLPLGVAFGASLNNMAFLSIGIPIGMAIGLAVGTNMDKKAFEEGRQLDFEPTF
jgi:hypothetical protein